MAGMQVRSFLALWIVWNFGWFELFRELSEWCLDGRLGRWAGRDGMVGRRVCSWSLHHTWWIENNITTSLK